MAGDLDIARVSAPLPAEATRELIKPTLVNEPKLKDDPFDTEDVSENRRTALEKAIAASELTGTGKLIIEQDAETGRFVQKLVDPSTGEILRQWPEEKFLELVKSLGEAYGLLVDRSV